MVKIHNFYGQNICSVGQPQPYISIALHYAIEPESYSIGTIGTKAIFCMHLHAMLLN